MRWMGTYKLWSGSSCTSTTSCLTAAALFLEVALFLAMAAFTFFFEGVSRSSSSSSSPLLARTEDTRSDCLPTLRFLAEAVLAGVAFFFLPPGVLGVEPASPLPTPPPPTSFRRSFCKCCLLRKRC